VHAEPGARRVLGYVDAEGALASAGQTADEREHAARQPADDVVDRGDAGRHARVNSRACLGARAVGDDRAVLVGDDIGAAKGLVAAACVDAREVGEHRAQQVDAALACGDAPLDLASEQEQAARREPLAHDARVVLDVVGAGDGEREVGEPSEPADGFPELRSLERVLQRDSVDGHAVTMQLHSSAPDSAIRRVEEVLSIEVEPR
jgi:hypothetical protein